MSDIREISCDHIIEDPKAHPPLEHVFIGNLMLDMCLTCYNALKGQVLEGALKNFFTLQTLPPIKLKVKKGVK